MTTPLRGFGSRARRAMDEAQPAFDEAAGRRRFLTVSTSTRGGVASRWWKPALAMLAAVGVMTATLRLRGHREERFVATETAVTVPFEEGSSAVVAPDAELRVISRDASGARVELVRGRVNVSVRHQANTDWHVLVGPWDVAVTGTRLSVQWRPAERSLEVEVFEGVVEVRSADGSATTVRAGERFESRAGLIRPAPVELPPAVPVPPPGPDAQQPPPVVEFDAGPTVRHAPPPPAKPWVALELAGRYLEARDAVRAAGVARVLAVAPVDELLSVARAARFASDDGLATEALMMARRRFPATPQAAMAAFLLGRESEGAEAASWFQKYLAEEPNGALARESAGRLLEALMQAGRHTEAQASAASYLERYPTGPHAPYARSLREMVKP
jgi:uncharacterized cupin superfamily protein